MFWHPCPLYPVRIENSGPFCSRNTERAGASCPGADISSGGNRKANNSSISSDNLQNQTGQEKRRKRQRELSWKKECKCGDVTRREGIFLFILVDFMDKSGMRTTTLSQKMLASTCICFGSQWMTQCIVTILFFKHSCYTLYTCAPLLIAFFLLNPRDTCRNWDILYYGHSQFRGDCQEDGDWRQGGTNRRMRRASSVC